MHEANAETVKINSLHVSAYKIPTDFTESDGTLEWDSTTMILVKINAGNETGIGFTYADVSTALLIEKTLKNKVLGQNAMDINSIFNILHKSVRNNGNSGIAFMAISAIDVALWDLKAKILQQPLCELLGKTNERIQVYGSGGFTSYSDAQLSEQLGGWAEQGLKQVKMKIGREPEKDLHRVAVGKNAVGKSIELFVDANGAYSLKQALTMAEEFQLYGVRWFEEPVSSDDVYGMKTMRQKAPAGMNIAAGEYAFNIFNFKKILEHQMVDVLQADATRCGGITGFLKAAVLAEAFNIPFSFHCAPSIHLHAAMAVPGFYTGEYFHDHVRIEKMFFEGFREPQAGYMSPDLNRIGLGLEFREADVEKYRIEFS